MLVLTTWMLAATLLQVQAQAPAPAPRTGASRRIDINCEVAGALDRALARARRLGSVDIYLDGVCKGNFVIASDGVTLRAATPGSGLAAPDDDPGFLPVLEVVNAEVSLRGLAVRGGGVGVLAGGWDAEVLLFEVDFEDQVDLGVFATRGALVRLIDTAVHDGNVGISADSDATVNLQNVVVSHQRVGVIVFEESFAALNNTTIEGCSEAGLSVGNRSDANVVGGVFRENGQVHVSASDWSNVTLLSEVTIGSETDATPYALGAGRNASIASYSSPAIYGDVSALDRGSIRLGNTVLHGDLIALQFADAHVRDSEITGTVICLDGSDAICSLTPTAGAFGCSSTTCGTANADAVDRAQAVSGFPEVEVRRVERPRRSRTQR